jgi:hypothetical protein
VWGSGRPTSLELCALFLKAMRLCNLHVQSLHSTHVSMSDRNVAAQDEQPLLDQIPASPPHRQAQPRLPAQRPRAQPSAARLWIISALVLVGVVLSFLTQIGYMGAGSSKGGHHNDVFKHGQSKGGSEGQSQKQDQAVMSGKRSVGYFVSLTSAKGLQSILADTSPGQLVRARQERSKPGC